MFETIRITPADDGITRLTLDRPEKHNAMSGLMIAELTEAAAQIAADAATRVVILAGNGPSFCAGGDLAWMRAQIEAEPEQRFEEARKLATMLGALNTLPQPMIGRIHANAFGGGVGLASVCDVAVGVPGLQMGLTETRLGLIPATIGPYVLARMGEAKARRVFMSSRRFAAEEAQELGLLARIVPAEALDEAVLAEARPYLDCAPGAVAEAKRLARSLGPAIDAAVIDASIRALVTRWDSAEAAEGIAAFFEKRKPKWAP